MHKSSETVATRVALVLALTATGCASSATPGTGATGSAIGSELHWDHLQSDIVEDGHEARVDYWLRGDEVIRQYRENGVLTYDERCQGKRVTILELLPAESAEKPAFNYREVTDRDSVKACFDAATHEELRYLKDPAQLSKPETVSLAGGRLGLRWVGGTGHEFVVDALTKLPARLSYGSEESGGVTSISFGPFTTERVSDAPAMPEVPEWAGFQETLEVPAEEAGAALGLAAVPKTVAGLPLRHAWSYRTQNLRSPSYYLIWGDDSRNVQMVSTEATLPTALLGFAADGTEYDSQEGARHVKVGTIGGDAALLHKALQVLEPSALSDGRVRAEEAPSPLQR